MKTSKSNLPRKRWSNNRLNIMGQKFSSLQKTLAEWLTEDLDFKDEVKAMADFKISDDIEAVESLCAGTKIDNPELPFFILERLAPFFEMGLWVHQKKNWQIPAFFWRGQIFAMSESEYLPAQGIIPKMSPVEVKTTSAQKILTATGLDFITLSNESNAFLFKPTTDCAFVLVSDIPKPWIGAKINHVLKLINSSFDN